MTNRENDTTGFGTPSSDCHSDKSVIEISRWQTNQIEAALRAFPEASHIAVSGPVIQTFTLPETGVRTGYRDVRSVDELSHTELLNRVTYTPADPECPLRYTDGRNIERGFAHPAYVSHGEKERLGVVIEHGGKHYRGHVAHVVFLLKSGRKRRYGCEIHHRDGNSNNNLASNLIELASELNGLLQDPRDHPTATGISSIKHTSSGKFLVAARCSLPAKIASKRTSKRHRATLESPLSASLLRTAISLASADEKRERLGPVASSAVSALGHIFGPAQLASEIAHFYARQYHIARNACAQIMGDWCEATSMGFDPKVGPLKKKIAAAAKPLGDWLKKNGVKRPATTAHRYVERAWLAFQTELLNAPH